MTTSTTETTRLSTITASARAAELNAAAVARCEAEGSILFGTLVEDADFWAEMGVVTGLDLERSLLIGSISDSYKERYGIRPRFYNWDEMSLADLQEALDRLIPTEEELEADRLEAEAADQMWAEYQARCDAEDDANSQAALQAEADRAEDALWAVQDALMGF